MFKGPDSKKMKISTELKTPPKKKARFSSDSDACITKNEKFTEETPVQTSVKMIGKNANL